MRALIVVLAVLVVAGAGAFAIVGGDVPLPTGDEPNSGAFPTATQAPGGGSGDATGTPTGGTTDTGPFALTIDEVAECGRTCRDVTVSLTNQQNEAATDVVVHTRVFAGNSTDPSDEVWRGSETVGTLEAGATHTATRRVELSYSEAYAVDQADGWVTIQTTIETDDQTVTFSERRDVA